MLTEAILQIFDFLVKMNRRKSSRIATRELDAVLKQQCGSETDQSNRSKVMTSSPTSFGGRRNTLSCKTAESKVHKEDDKPVKEEALNDDIEATNSEENADSVEEAAFQSPLPYDKMSSLEAECFPDLQGPTILALIQIRNSLLKMWFENPKKQLTECAAQKIEAPYSGDPALVLRTHAFLERNGFINDGMYERVTPLPHPTNTDMQQIKREPEETQHDIDELPLDPNAACSLYEGHKIKEEMVIGPTVFQKQTIQYAKIVLKKIKPTNNEGAEKQTTEEISRNVDTDAHQNIPTFIKEPVFEGTIPDVSVHAESQLEVTKKAAGTKSKVKINKTANKNSNLQRPNPVTKRAETNITFSNQGSFVSRVHAHTCDICDYSTNDVRSFNLHSEAHAAAKKYCCVNCSYITTRKRGLISHVREHTNNYYLFACETCDAKFKNIDNLKAHLRTHAGEKPYSCEVCQKSFNLKSHFTQHRRIHTGEKPYSCDVCAKSFNRKNILKNHRLIHTGEKPYSCDICSKHFNRKGYLQYHRRIHTGEKQFSCQVCRKSCNSMSYLIQHRRIHMGEKPCSCDVCYKSFNTMASLNKHRRTHKREKLYSCDICHKNFTQKSYVAKHLLIHKEEKPYSCDVCHKSFKQKIYLSTHRHIHTGEKPYTCDLCHKSFTVKSDIVKHLQSHKTDKLYSCDVCRKRFTNKSYLVRHMRTHTREKSYTCDICQKSFKARANLVTHLRLHTGNKPYSCDVCHKSFYVKYNFNQHRRIHTGEKPFSCDVCLKRFSSKSHLISHRRMHTGEKPYSCDVCYNSFTRKATLDKHRCIQIGKKGTILL